MIYLSKVVKCNFLPLKYSKRENLVCGFLNVLNTGATDVLSVIFCEVIFALAENTALLVFLHNYTVILCKKFKT